jgi:hypothetical protein
VLAAAAAAAAAVAVAFRRRILPDSTLLSIRMESASAMCVLEECCFRFAVLRCVGVWLPAVVGQGKGERGKGEGGRGLGDANGTERKKVHTKDDGTTTLP